MIRMLQTSPRHVLRLASTTLSILALAACATTADQSPSLFVLDENPPTTPDTVATGAPKLVVTPVAIANYLDQGGLVYQTGPHRIVIANDNRWASPLAGQLTDSLYGVVASQLTDIDVERHANSSHSAYRLQTRVDSFTGHYDGSAHIAGHWALIGPDGKAVDSASFERRIPLAEDGYPALVSSLSDGWQDTARRIAVSFRDRIYRSTTLAD